MQTSLLVSTLLCHISFMLNISKCSEQCYKAQKVTNVIILGGNGDLAQKYLWDAFHKLHIENKAKNEDVRIRFFSSARSGSEIGRRKLENILKNLKCSNQQCQDSKLEFIDNVDYVQLNSSANFENFCAQLESNKECSKENKIEVGRIFYLAIPAGSYTKVLEKIHSYCKPSNSTWLKILLEKPFGYDYKSAENLSTFIHQLFTENQIIRIDHYLAKNVVSSISKFRSVNKAILSPLWNSHHISMIRIKAFETEDVKKRLKYFDSSGIIRDMIQNHLMELILLVTTDPDLHRNPDLLDKAKIKVLQSMPNITKKQVLVGQYSEYQNHLKEEFQDYNVPSNTPTFAAVLMYLESSSWRSVPILIECGKAMHVKETYIEIEFKQIISFPADNSYKVNHPTIRFQINPNSKSFQEGIYFSKAFGTLNTPYSNWKYVKDINNDFSALLPKVIENPYLSIFRDVCKGKTGDQVISTKRLLEMWRVWNDYLEIEDESLFKYSLNDFSGLAFRIKSGFIQPLKEVEVSKDCSLKKFIHHDSYVCEIESLIIQMVKVIKDLAIKVIGSKGSFHIGLSGGTSPSRLYAFLAEREFDFPWDDVHLWIIDERCVPRNASKSNFGLIDRVMLSKINIKYSNVHPVLTKKGLCTPHIAQEYEEELIHYLGPNTGLDLAILGIGEDGHTASIFPHSKFEDEKLIEVTDGPDGLKRITMTPTLLKNSRNFVVLATGQRKRDILKRVVDGEQNLPILDVTSDHEKVMWFIDSKSIESGA